MGTAAPVDEATAGSPPATADATVTPAAGETPAGLPNSGESNLFDLSEEYDAMLNRGISLSGEDKRFFLEGRVRDLQAHLPAGFDVRRVLDFGCGIGDSTQHLANCFPEAEVVGIDTAEGALLHARQTYASARISFATVEEFGRTGANADFDLCYVNGVFHHIPPGERHGAAALIARALRPGGLLALFENNPWNPGTRLVMSRIPFDRDAITLPPPETRQLVLSAGFSRCRSTRFLFYFPRSLKALRGVEPALASLPLGAQYYVLAQR